jgi:hypothetical protein
MENMMPTHQNPHAPVETTVGAPLSRCASEEVLLPVHQATGCDGAKTRLRVIRSGPGPKITTGAPYERRGDSILLLPVHPWPAASAVLSGPGPEQLHTADHPIVRAAAPRCAGSNLGTITAHTHPLSSHSLLPQTHQPYPSPAFFPFLPQI